jgi:ABC-2 type transport system ATP-binding protein
MISAIPSVLQAENPVITTRDLVKFYRKNRALDGLDLTVPDGAVYLMVGPNGSGKTTTMKILLDLIRADSGQADVFSISTATSGAEVRAAIGYVPEGRIPGYEWMQVGLLLKHHSIYYPSWHSDYADFLTEKLEIDLRKKFKKLSKGESRRVQLVMALAHHPPLLLLDEPMDGLDPLARDRVIEILIDHISETSATVLASTHHIEELDKLADHMGVLFEGKLLSQNRREEIHASLKRYLLEVPGDWNGAPDLKDAIVHSNGTGPEISWEIWGDETSITGKLKSAGATVRSVVPLRLEEAAVAILAGKEQE